VTLILNSIVLQNYQIEIGLATKQDDTFPKKYYFSTTGSICSQNYEYVVEVNNLKYFQAPPIMISNDGSAGKNPSMVSGEYSGAGKQKGIELVMGMLYQCEENVIYFTFNGQIIGKEITG
jgi:hypothetical protein